MAKAEDALIENLNAFVAFARKRVGDPHLAADLVQDSLLPVMCAANMVAWTVLAATCRSIEARRRVVRA